ncbi:hypothetical protein AB5I39_13980 [Sphingomonas sp. MMS24-J45]|uniref:hypothetical protein n=1 Tax=Sphingomonas sp. MMS24-J45 TaxID=3238806 RepID=UPI00384B4A26
MIFIFLLGRGMMRKIKSAQIVAVILAAMVSTGTKAAQDDPNAATVAETARLSSETALINARAAEKNAEAALTKAKIDALGLPSFSGTTSLGSGAGSIEATILATAALNKAAEYISLRKPGLGVGKGYLVLAGDESARFDLLGTVRAQLDGLRQAFSNAGINARPSPNRLTPQMAVAAVSAVAGLFRAETTVSGIDMTALTPRALATATTQRLGNAYLLSVPTFPADEMLDDGKDWAGQTILQRVDTLSGLREGAVTARNALPKEPKGAQATKAARLDAAVSRFDAFLAKATSPDDKGLVTIAEAARQERLKGKIGSILRVDLDKAGGSIVNTKNIATTFGVDPVKISGGLIASYSYTDPSDGRVQSAGVLFCRTTLTALRHVQEGGGIYRQAERVFLPIVTSSSEKAVWFGELP